MSGRYMAIVASLLFIVGVICCALLVRHYGNHLWVWLAIAGIGLLEVGVFFGWFSAGAYLRRARTERKEGQDPWWWENMAIHDGVLAVVSLAVAVAFFALAGLFK